MAVALRRPFMLLWSEWTQNCFDCLEEAGSNDDRDLVSLIRLQKIAEESAVALGLYHLRPVDLKDRAVVFGLNAFDKQLMHWRDKDWSHASSE